MKHAAMRCIAVLGGSALLSQSQEPPSTFRVDVRLVEVHATFRDEQGRYLDDLSKEQILVLEDGKPQDIVAFEPPDTRLTCGILLDITGSMQRALPAVQSAVLRFIDLLRDRDRVAVYAFNDSLRSVQGSPRTRRASASWEFDPGALPRSSTRLPDSVSLCRLSPARRRSSCSPMARTTTAGSAPGQPPRGPDSRAYPFIRWPRAPR